MLFTSADQPGHAAMLNTTGSNSYTFCIYCKMHGSYCHENRHIYYPFTKPPPGTPCRPDFWEDVSPHEVVRNGKLHRTAAETRAWRAHVASLEGDEYQKWKKFTGMLEGFGKLPMPQVIPVCAYSTSSPFPTPLKCMHTISCILRTLPFLK